jgi:hypothetical protein
MGTYLASLVIYAQLFNEAPPALPVLGNAGADAPVLHRAAQTALANAR